MLIVAREEGQAALEWTALVLLAALGFGALVAAVPAVDGRSLGGLLAHAFACAAGGGCDDGQDALAATYGERDAALVRRYAPGLVYEPGTYTLPVDWRRCRSHRCSDAPDDRDLDVHRSARGGMRATAFTHVVRDGGETFLQYWLYYPDSTTTVAKAAGAWNTLRRLGARLPRYPGAHADDWESFQVRIDGRGRASVRASAHHDYQACKHPRCRNRWTGWTGWTRVSRGSHAGHIPLRPRLVAVRSRGGWPPGTGYRYEPLYPGVDLHERTTTSAGLRLVPLEAVDPGEYRPLAGGVGPPWTKRVYEDPRSDSTG